MKIKHFIIFVFCAVPVLVLTRIVQFITIIDQNGYYKTNIGNLIYLEYALPILLGACVIFLAILYFMKGKKTVTFDDLFYNSVPTKIIACLLSITLIWETVLKIIANKIDLSLLFSILCFLYFIAFALSNKKLIKIFAIGPISYACARLVIAFFETFKSINASENVYIMISLCCIVILFMAISKLSAGIELYCTRFVLCSLFFMIFSSVSITASLLSGIDGLLSLCPIIIDFLTFAFCLFSVIRALFIKDKPVENITPADDILEKMPKFIDDIEEI